MSKTKAPTKPYRVRCTVTVIVHDGGRTWTNTTRTEPMTVHCAHHAQAMAEGENNLAQHLANAHHITGGTS